MIFYRDQSCPGFSGTDTEPLSAVAQHGFPALYGTGIAVLRLHRCSEQKILIQDFPRTLRYRLPVGLVRLLAAVLSQRRTDVLLFSALFRAAHGDIVTAFYQPPGTLR